MFSLMWMAHAIAINLFLKKIFIIIRAVKSGVCLFCLWNIVVHQID